MDLETIMLSKISQTEKVKKNTYDFTPMCGIKLKATNEQTTYKQKFNRHKHQCGGYQKEKRLWKGNKV